MKVSTRYQGDEPVFLPDEFVGLTVCPHCMTRRPSLKKRYQIGKGAYSFTYEREVHWAVYSCSSCEFPISLLHTRKTYEGKEWYTHQYLVFPERWSPDEAIPERPRRYLAQANETLSNPDASVVMAASAIDAMLKAKGLEEGSLHKRIGVAVEQGLLTKDMSQWAHLVRLNSNNPRHADGDSPHMTTDDAKLSLEFAKALAEVLFVLPARMPPADDSEPVISCQ